MPKWLPRKKQRVKNKKSQGLNPGFFSKNKKSFLR